MVMASAPNKLYADDVSLIMVLIDTNPLFWSSSSLKFSQFLSHVLAFINAILTLNQLNQVVVIATGYGSCDYVFDSSLALNREINNGTMSAVDSSLLRRLKEFVDKDEELASEVSTKGRVKSSLLSGSLSMALCYIQRVFRSGPLHPQPRSTHILNPCASQIGATLKGRREYKRLIFCVQGSPDGPEQYVAIMNSIFSAQRSMVPIDSCYIGAQNSAYLQQASYITGGVHHKPQHLDGLLQYLLTVFATDLHSRSFLQLPKPAGVDFRASCFCHKNTIDMGYICSVCLSIFCSHHKKCSTCGSIFGQSLSQSTSNTPDKKGKGPDP